MHATRLDRSPRLQRMLALLSDGHPHSTLEIIQRAHVCAVNSIAAELRRNGLPVRCTRVGDRWFYQLGGK